MQCLTCKSAKELISPGTDLLIGAISETDTDVYVYVENIADGSMFRHSATSSSAGVVTISLASPGADFYHDKTTYEIWVTKQDEDIADAQTLTIGAQTTECISVIFKRLLDGSGVFVTSTGQEIELIPAA